VIEYRPGQRIWYIGEGVQIIHPRAEAGADWWDPNGDGLCIWAAYQPKGAANQAASYTDLSGNGNNAGVGVAPTWDAVNGWVFNGANQYLTTTFVPQNDQSQSVIVQFTGAAAQGCLAGMYDLGTNSAFRVYGVWVVAATLRYANGVSINVAPPLAAGNLGVAGNAGYRNGVADGGAIGAWAGPTVVPLYIGCVNQGGPTHYFDGEIQALAIYDCTLTAPQMAAVAAAMAAL